MKPYTYEIAVVNPLIPAYPDTYSGEVTAESDEAALVKAARKYFLGPAGGELPPFKITNRTMTFTDKPTMKDWEVTVFPVRASVGVMALDVLTCEGCGVCCTYCGCPPGYMVKEWRPADLPTELHRQLDDLAARVEAGEKIDGSPCAWWDQATKKCKHYEFRPKMCRDFEPGSIDCQRVRMRILGHN